MATSFDLMKIVFVACRTAESVVGNISHPEESLLGLTPAQLQVCIETADKKLRQSAVFFHIPLPEEYKNKQTEQPHISLRQQAIDYSIVQNALPSPLPTKELPQILHQIHQGLDILFGIKVALCLLVNNQRSSLHAIGHPDCFGWKFLSDIFISLKSEKSPIVKTFTTGKLKISMVDEPDCELSLADRQIIQVLDSAGIISVPMISSGKTIGVLVLGIQKKELLSIRKQQNRLEQFVARAATNLRSSSHIQTGKKTQ
jgi:hypothetical protein